MFQMIVMFFFTFSMLFFSGCSNEKSITIPADNLKEKKIDFTNKLSQSKMRDIQTRVFQGIRKDIIEKAVVNTMVDEDFFVTLIDNKQGVITANGNKNTLDLRFIALIKENMNQSISVRFNVDTIKTESFNKSYTIVKNDMLYEYLFSKLVKSISLENEQISKVIKIEKQQLKAIPKDIKEVDFKVTQVNDKTLKQQEKVSFPFYSIQFTSAKNKYIAKKLFENISKKYKEVRLEKLKYFYVIRLGKFESYSEIKKIYDSLEEEYKNSIIVSIKSEQ